MNGADVRAIPVYGGFEAQFRKIHRADWFSVEVSGIVQIYDTREQAEVAAYRALMKSLFGDGILRDGETISAPRSKAEALFGKIWPGRGRKPVVVERR